MVVIAAILTILTWIPSVRPDWTPVGANRWRLTGDSTRFIVRIATTPDNYQLDDSSWAPISTEWKNEGNSLFVNREAVLRTEVTRDGISVIRVDQAGWSCLIKQKPIGVVLVDTTNGVWTPVTGLQSEEEPVIESNVLSWSGLWNGVDFQIRQQPGSVSHTLYFHPDLLDTVVEQWELPGTPSNLALGSVMEYTMENIDDVDDDFWASDFRTLRKSGRNSLTLSHQRLNFPGSDTLAEIPVRQLWKRVNGKLYEIECVSLSAIRSIHRRLPEATLWHNDNITITYGDIEDASINSQYSDRNYGGGVELAVYTSPERRFLIRLKNLSSLIGAGYRIDSGRVFIKSRNAYTAGSAYLYRAFKPWEEGNLDNVVAQDGQGLTWADWAATAYEWGTAGCDNASDDGGDNNTDGGGYDRRATEESYVANVSGTQWHSWPLSVSLLQGWYDGSINEEGLLCRTLSSSMAVTFYSTEFSTEANRPYFLIYYSVAADSGPNARRRNITAILNGGR